MTNDELRDAVLHYRGVQDPCPKCRGVGVRSYSSTATWCGGMGGHGFTSDVCDACWGSGDANCPWTDLRKLGEERQAWENEQCIAYFARATGATLSSSREHMREIANILDREERRRKTPEGFEPFWWRCTLRIVAGGLRGLAKETSE